MRVLPRHCAAAVPSLGIPGRTLGTAGTGEAELQTQRVGGACWHWCGLTAAVGRYWALSGPWVQDAVTVVWGWRGAGLGQVLLASLWGWR